jgi:Uma2 family endonuclease
MNVTDDPTLCTVEDYLSMPEGGPRYELIEGELLMAPAPNRFHQDISGNLALILGNYVRKHRIGKIYNAPFDVYLDEINVVQPDIVFISNEKANVLTDAGAEGAPDLVIEILSPSTMRRDRELKRKVYARTGVEELWLIDPEKRRIEIFELQENSRAPRQIVSEKDVFTRLRFPGLKISCAEIFAA